MDMLEQVAALLRSLGASLGVPLHLDSAGACGMRIDDRLEVTLRYEPSPPALLAYSPVGDLPAGAIDGLLRTLLEANHVWDGSRGATWSLSGESVVLSRLFPLPELESEILATELAVFVEVALAGQQALQPSSPASMSETGYVETALPPGAITP
jgi:hypothetical protein